MANSSPRRVKECGTWFTLAALGLIVLVLLPGSIQAQSVTPQGSAAAVLRADQMFEKEDYAGAEPLYLQALTGKNSQPDRHCHERLLQIYTQLGRSDRAVQMARNYEQMLSPSKDADRLRDLRLQRGEWLFTLGHFRDCAEPLEMALTAREMGKPLSASRRLAALIILARAALHRDDQETARGYFRQAEELALAELSGKQQTLTLPRQIEFVHKLDDCYRFQEEHLKAIPWLKELSAQLAESSSFRERCETLQRLAFHQSARGEDEAAEQNLREALRLQGRISKPPPLLEGDLTLELAACLQRRNNTKEADKFQDKAVKSYDAVLKTRGKSSLAAFWKLQQVYQASNLYSKAYQLAVGQHDQWGMLPRPHLQSEQGSLQVILGAFREARQLLREAVGRLEQQDPPNLIDLPRALNNLAIVEQLTESPTKAEQRGQQCLDLYQRYQLVPDLIQVETYDLLGTCSALRGDYAQGIERFRNGVALCTRLGQPADPLQSNLLLNMALLHRSQGDLPEALRTCERAQEVYERFAQPDALGHAAFRAARASIHLAQGKVREAQPLVEPILDICRKNQVEGGLLVVAALHAQALDSLDRRRFALATEGWNKVLAIQQGENQTLFVPRTLNYLALTAELQGHLEEAEKLYGRALDLQQANQRALPTTQFITCWRLALVVDRLGKHGQSRQLLRQAIDIVEAARLKTFGESKQRAVYFAQFEPAFDLLVRWSIRDGDLEGAFSAMVRGRSRTLLDQLQTAQVDPRAELTGPAGEKLRQREDELHRRMAGLRARAQLLSLDELETDPAKKLLADFDATQKAYAEVWTEVVNASQRYRSLAVNDPSARALEAFRGLGPRTMLLVYHVGREESFLMVGHAGKLSVVPLHISAEMLKAKAPEPPPLDQALAGGRGMVFRPESRPVPVPEVSTPGKQVALNSRTAETVVETYRQQIADAEFQPSRGFVFRSNRKDQPVAVQRQEMLADALLPPEVRRQIKSNNTDKLIVIPDGPLHKLPLEALVIDSGKEPRYLLDELPPIVYAPSLSILSLLTDRKPGAGGPLTLLSVCNPTYPQLKESEKGIVAVDYAVGIRGQLPTLPFTAQESRSIRAGFPDKQVKVLEGDDATEPAVAEAVRGKRILHIAAHGFADTRFGNLFGALALTPPAPGKEKANNDGFLSLHEIYALPLQDCELAVLSACVTNVGPQRAMEAGVTLASGFLVAGARRVVASQWSVDDNSTAVLMGRFFKEVTAAADRGQPISYAEALQQARKHIRGQAKWSSPYYWAPFVLLGPEN